VCAGGGGDDALYAGSGGDSGWYATYGAGDGGRARCVVEAVESMVCVVEVEVVLDAVSVAEGLCWGLVVVELVVLLALAALLGLLPMLLELGPSALLVLVLVALELLALELLLVLELLEEVVVELPVERACPDAGTSSS